MIKVTVLYQDTQGKKFDMAYYLGKHIPMVKQKLGAACKRIEVDQGLGGGQPGSKPQFVDAIMGDVPNYTNIQPIIQVNEVKL